MRPRELVERREHQPPGVALAPEGGRGELDRRAVQGELLAAAARDDEALRRQRGEAARRVGEEGAAAVQADERAAQRAQRRARAAASASRTRAADHRRGTGR